MGLGAALVNEERGAGLAWVHGDAAERLRVCVAVVKRMHELVERAHVQHAVRHVEVNVSGGGYSEGEVEGDGRGVYVHLQMGTTSTQAAVCSMCHVLLMSASSPI